MPPCTSLRRRPLALFALATLLSLGSVMAAQQTPPTPQWQPQTPALQSDWMVPASFRVGPGDVLAIQAYDMPELSRTAAVDAAGALDLGYLQRPLPVAGLTTAAIARRLAAALRLEQIALDPQIAVQVWLIRSHPITVSGEVRRPGILQAEKPLTLLDALLRAGGASDRAGNVVLLSRGNAHGAVVTRRFDLSAVLASADPSSNPWLQTGDAVQVLPAGQVFVAGAVEAPGAFLFQPGERLTAAAAVALAHGWKLDGKPEHAILVRVTPQGGTKELLLNLRRIMNRQVPDPLLEANDILYVPGNNRKSASLFALKSLATTAAVGLGYFIAK